MDKSLVLLFVFIVAASGCVSDSGQGSESRDGLESDSVFRYTVEDGDTWMALSGNNDTGEFDFEWRQKSNVTGNELFTRYESANLTATVACGFVQDISYNFSETWGNPETENLGGFSELENGLGPEVGNRIPKWTFEELEADKVEYKLIQKGSSNVVASCQPNRDDLNLEIDVDEK